VFDGPTRQMAAHAGTFAGAGEAPRTFGGCYPPKTANSIPVRCHLSPLMHEEDGHRNAAKNRQAWWWRFRTATIVIEAAIPVTRLAQTPLLKYAPLFTLRASGYAPVS